MNASPTKEFFISMLTKDVGLVPAITDLIDNCLDGARRLRKSGSYEGLRIQVKFSADHFEVSDNCGGIDVEVARNYAFRFGRPEGIKEVPHSIGQFGVGMKRALFKLGRKFSVESTTTSTRFSLAVDVEDWKRDQSPEWTFKFKSAEKGLSVPVDKTGTKVEVTALLEEIKRQLAMTSFVDELRHHVSLFHARNIERGIQIQVNGVTIKSAPAELKRSSELTPAYKSLKLDGKKKAEISVHIYVGVDRSDPHRAGWYVYCNDRLILGPDHTEVTGWGETWAEAEGGDTKTGKVPAYHNQFAPFRGYVFLDADDPSVLPWNTTKTGVEAEHPVYRRVRQEMMIEMRPVIDFCNRMKDEKEGSTSAGPLEKTYEKAEAVPIGRIRSIASFGFAYPRRTKKGTPAGEVNIEYRKPRAEVDRVMKHIKARSPRAAGIKTFEYYLRNVVADE